MTIQPCASVGCHAPAKVLGLCRKHRAEYLADVRATTCGAAQLALHFHGNPVYRYCDIYTGHEAEGMPHHFPPHAWER